MSVRWAAGASASFCRRKWPCHRAPPRCEGAGCTLVCDESRSKNDMNASIGLHFGRVKNDTNLDELRTMTILDELRMTEFNHLIKLHDSTI